MNYYTTEKITDRVYRITDFLKDCCYLVIGDDRACLLDTLNGFGNIREVAENLTDKPLFVVLTHGHIDHGSGCVFFDEVWMNHRDQHVFEDTCSIEFRAGFYTKNPLSRHIDVSEYNPIYTGEIKDIEDGQEFELGGVTIKMIAAPGHTQGMMVPLIKEERIIIFGDACGVGVLLGGPNSSCVSDYRQTLLKLKSFEDQYDRIFRNHGTFWSPKELLDNVIECCDDILAGKNRDQIVVTHGTEYHIAKPVDENDQRLDGKQGNIKYTLDKAI